MVKGEGILDWDQTVKFISVYYKFLDKIPINNFDIILIYIFLFLKNDNLSESIYLQIIVVW